MPLPRILLVDDMRKHNVTLLIAPLVEIIRVQSFEEFEAVLQDTSNFQLAIVYPLVMTEERRKRNMLTATRRLRAVFDDKPIVTHETARNFHGDLLKSGFSHVVSLSSDVEPLLAKLLGIIPYPPVQVPTARPPVSIRFCRSRRRPRAPIRW